MKTISSLFLALLVAITCRYGVTEEKWNGSAEETNFGPLRFMDCAYDSSCSLVWRKKDHITFLMVS